MYRGITVKNSTKDGNRPVEDYRADLAAAIGEFEESCGVTVDSNILAVLGATGFPPTSKKAKAYTHPFPYVASYDAYVFGSVSVPADLDDGKSDYSNLFFLATDNFLVTIFNDPHWVYNPFFGGAVLSLLERNKVEDKMTVGETIIRIVGFTIAALDHSLEALENRYIHFNGWVPRASEHRHLLEDDLDRLYQPIQDLAVEVNSLSTVVTRTAALLESLAAHKYDQGTDSTFSVIFSPENRRTAKGLHLKSEQLIGFQSHLAFEVDSLLRRCDRLQESALTVATHRVTVLGALILVPNLLFDFFGQTFDPLPDWLQRSGYLLTMSLTLLYWGIHYFWFRKKRYL